MLTTHFKKLIRPLYKNLTGGESTIDLAFTINKLKSQNISPIIDYVREFSQGDSRLIMEEYYKIAKIKDADYVAVKPSSFEFNPTPIKSLVKYLIDHNKKVMIDAENIQYYNKINQLTDDLMREHNKYTVNIYKTYQMYIKDNYNQLEKDINLIPNLGIKLVRGAYHNQDKKSNQLYTKKVFTDNQYQKSLDLIFKNTDKNISAFICTHNSENIKSLINFVSSHPQSISKLYHASLYGFIEKEIGQIKNKVNTFKYLPYGPMEEAMPYLIRRLYENPKVLYFYFKN